VDVIPVDLLQQNLPKNLRIKKVLRNLPKKKAVSSQTYFIIPPYEQIWRIFLYPGNPALDAEFSLAFSGDVVKVLQMS